MALQGVDMVLYNTFKSLGLKTEVIPLLDLSSLDEMDEQEYEKEQDSYKSQPWSLGNESEDDHPVCECCAPAFPSFEKWKAKRPRIDRVGTRFHDLKWAESQVWNKQTRENQEEVSFRSCL